MESPQDPRNSSSRRSWSYSRSFSKLSRVLPAPFPVETVDEQPPRLNNDEEAAEQETAIRIPPNIDVSVQTDSAGATSYPFSRVGSRNLVSGSAEFVRQASKKIYGSAMEYATERNSLGRTVSFADLERGSSRYYKRNSLAFGQVVPVDDDDFFQQVLDRIEQDGTTVEEDVESGTKPPEDPSILPQETTLKPPPGGHPQNQPMTKEKGKSRIGTIIMEQSWFTVYKRLYIVTIILNLVALILAITNHFPYAKSNAVVFSLGNVMMCVLVRNEVFLRIVFWLAVHLLGYWWVPVKLKTMTTSLLQSVGGIHSGCGIGAVMWLSYAIQLTFRNRESASDAIIGVSFGILFLLALSSLAAFPIFRHIHHNLFERVHRFAGWSSLSLVWAFVLLSTFWDPAIKSYRLSDRTGHELASMQGLWFTVVTTIMIILPWLSVRRVPVQTLIPATKLNSLLNFKGSVEPGLLARISPSPFSEWHAFGIISDGQDRHTILAGAVGDFTKSLVENPPTHIWVRTFHFAGLPYLTGMYQKVLHVATGSGICVFLSFLLQPSKADVHIIWIAKKIRESYGDGIWEAINSAPPGRITVIDTAVSGRPKTKELTVKKAKEWGAEVVIVTSNPVGTNEIVNGCKAVGIPAYGPIWDS